MNPIRRLFAVSENPEFRGRASGARLIAMPPPCGRNMSTLNYSAGVI
jgi:hypothetical protein